MFGGEPLFRFEVVACGTTVRSEATVFQVDKYLYVLLVCHRLFRNRNDSINPGPFFELGIMNANFLMKLPILLRLATLSLRYVLCLFY